MPSNQTEAVTVGSFTLRENAGSGATCNAPTIANNSAFTGALSIGPGAGYGALPAGGTQVAVAGTNTANNLFAAILVNGSSEVSGDVGTDAISGLNGCITTGFITGV